MKDVDVLLRLQSALGAQPSNLIVFAIAAGVLARLLGRRKLARWLLYPAAAALLAISVLPLGQWLLVPLENRFLPPAEPPVDVDGIVALGGGIDLGVSGRRGMATFGDTGERFISLLELARRYPAARVMFSGGPGWRADTDLSEAQVMRGFLLSHGLDGPRLIFEDQARNTYENALLAKPLAAPEPGERWLLVTSAFHMPRAVGAFRQVGWPVIPYPVDYRTGGELSLPGAPDAGQRWRELDEAVRSWLGLIAYWLSGRIPTLFPAP
jgi:uncharacterized SAM-binding protein YcdF (DUF218 family)